MLQGKNASSQKQIHQNNIIPPNRNLQGHKSIKLFFKAQKINNHQPKFTMLFKVIFSNQ